MSDLPLRLENAGLLLLFSHGHECKVLLFLLISIFAVTADAKSVPSLEICQNIKGTETVIFQSDPYYDHDYDYFHTSDAQRVTSHSGTS